MRVRVTYITRRRRKTKENDSRSVTLPFIISALAWYYSGYTSLSTGKTDLFANRVETKKKKKNRIPICEFMKEEKKNSGSLPRRQSANVAGTKFTEFYLEIFRKCCYNVSIMGQHRSWTTVYGKIRVCLPATFVLANGMRDVHSFLSLAIGFYWLRATMKHRIVNIVSSIKWGRIGWVGYGDERRTNDERIFILI